MKPAYGQAHFLGVISREHVAEIARGDGEINFFAHFNLLGGNEVAIRREVIGYLRHQPPEIYGVCGGKHYIFPFEFVYARFACENFFDGGLAVVEVALDGDDVNVIALLRAHLQFLHFGYAVVGIEDHNLNAVGVLKPFKRGFARVARSCYKHQNFLLDTADIATLSQKIGQHG